MVPQEGEFKKKDFRHAKKYIPISIGPELYAIFKWTDMIDEW